MKHFKKIKLLIIILTLIVNVKEYAQIQTDNIAFQKDVNKRGAAAGAMLGIGIGARAEAMGGTFVSIADDPTALYWNPAGIAQISSISLQVTNSKWFVETDFNAVDLVVPVTSMNSSLGFHIAMLDYGKNPVRTVERPNGTGEKYSAFDFVAGLYWAYAITDRVFTGVGVKYFNQTIWHVSGSAVAFDLSILFKTPVDGLNLGGALSNFGPDFKLAGRDLTTVIDIDGRKDLFQNRDNVPVNIETETYPLPLLFRFGISYEYDLNEKNSVLFASNLNHDSNNKETVDIGFEGKIINSFFVRVGYQSLFADYSENGFVAGFGVNYKIFDSSTITFDYSYSDWGLFPSINRFSIGISAF